MASYIIDIWKDGELVQSVAGKWTDDEAPRLTLYYLGYYRTDRAQLLREQPATDDQQQQTELISEIHAPESAAAGVTILW
jgi:hypothetical protein